MNKNCYLFCFLAIVTVFLPQVFCEDYNPEQKLQELGVHLTIPGPPVANFVYTVRSGNLVFLSGHGPHKPEGGFVTGKVGKDLTVAEGAHAAQLTAVSLLSSLKVEIGDLKRVKRIIKVFGMVNATEDFTQHSQVINGCSDFLVKVFGNKAKHARAAVGMNSLPINFSVEIEMIVEVEVDENYQSLLDVVRGEHRTPEYSKRDPYRNPLQTLDFLGIKKNMHVVEAWPGKEGWYMEILAPYLRENGRYTAANFDLETQSDFFKKANESFANKIKESPELYDKVVVTELAPPNKVNIAPDASADMVVTFRNVHNWMWTDNGEQEAFKAFYRVLKPGGILGVIEHRALPDSTDVEAKSGYVKESYVIEIAEAAGFKLVAKSEVNANPKDSTIHEKGVWMLPPRLRVSEEEKEKYQKIGESDRMTLKFIKVVGSDSKD